MSFDPQKHNRRSIRLNGYDYTTPGAYFITVCTFQRESLFGEVVDGAVKLNDLGKIVNHAWHDLPNHYSHVIMDQFCIMPNHIHGIIILNDHIRNTGGSETRPYKNSRTDKNTHPDNYTQPYNNTRSFNSHPHPDKHHGLPEIVRAFKSFSSRRINELLESPGVPTWQRNYYDHIIRDEHELRAVQDYVLSNPLNWESDPDNPVISVTPPK